MKLNTKTDRLLRFMVATERMLDAASEVRKAADAVKGGQPAGGWITDRPPTPEDESNATDCVLVTYENGLTGWELGQDIRDNWDEETGVVAWQPIPMPYRKLLVQQPQQLPKGDGALMDRLIKFERLAQLVRLSKVAGADWFDEACQLAEELQPEILPSQERKPAGQ